LKGNRGGRPKENGEVADRGAPYNTAAGMYVDCGGSDAETGNQMKDELDRRSFLKVAGMSLGIGVVYQFAPFLARRAEAGGITDLFKRLNGEAPASFTFAQFSDPHVGFQGPPDPLGTRAFESAVELLNRSAQRPDFVLFTGDLTHDADSRDAHAQRMQLFKSVAGRIQNCGAPYRPG